MRRVGVIGLEHETNTFRPTSTPLAEFTITRGDDLLAERGRRTYASGMFDGIDAIGAEVVPLVTAAAQPSGSIAADAYAALKAELVAAATSVRSSTAFSSALQFRHHSAVKSSSTTRPSLLACSSACAL